MQPRRGSRCPGEWPGHGSSPALRSRVLGDTGAVCQALLSPSARALVRALVRPRGLCPRAVGPEGLIRAPGLRCGGQRPGGGCRLAWGRTLAQGWIWHLGAETQAPIGPFSMAW